jgi:hypothetical protein
MRKLLMAVAGAIVIAIAVAGVAGAVNEYRVHLASSKSASKGTPAKPSPASLKFGYQVNDSEDLRPQVIREYRIAAEGLQSFPDARPSCTYDQATNPNVGHPRDLATACRRAIVGGGTIHNEAGAPTDRSQKLTCDVRLTLINISTGDPRYPNTVSQIRKRGGIAIRIDQYLDENGLDDPKRCPQVDLHEALAAPFYDVKIQGVPSAELRFTVPETLAHPGGLDNSVRVVTSSIKRLTGSVRIRGENRRVAFYSSVGRKGRARTTRVTFVDESDVKRTAVRESR